MKKYIKEEKEAGLTDLTEFEVDEVEISTEKAVVLALLNGQDWGHLIKVSRGWYVTPRGGLKEYEAADFDCRRYCAEQEPVDSDEIVAAHD